MTLDLTKLRQNAKTAEAIRLRGRFTSFTYQIMPSTVLTLLDRLDRAEQKLSAIRAHVVDAPHYVSADQLRQHLLEMLDADVPVFPSLMSQIKEDKP